MPGIGFLSNEAVALKPTFFCPSAWLSGYEDPVVSRINMRIQDLTGLDVSTAEELQVANYGVGGQYEPHFDFARVSERVTLLRFGELHV